VVAVEPQPDFVRLLSLLYGRDRHVAIVPVALGREAGHAEIYVSERIANKMLQHYIGGSAGTSSPLADLTDRELEVFRLIGHGHGTRQIAEALHLSVKTVESYQAHIKEKLSLHNARELVQHAIQWSIRDKSA